MVSLKQLANGFLAERLDRGGGVGLYVGAAVDFIYGSEVWERDRKHLRSPSRDDETREGGLLNRGEPICILELIGNANGTNDARISTHSKGEVWTYAEHLMLRTEEED